MKVLLVALNAKYIHSNLAVYSLQANSQLYSENVVVKEYTINNREEDVLKDLFLEKPDVIMFSCYLWNIQMVLSLASGIAKISPEVPIWLGGPEVSFETEKLCHEYSFIKGCMCGEGEETFRELLQFYHSKEIKLKDIKGIVYRERDGKISSTSRREALDMDTLVFPYNKIEIFAHRIVYYESSRGCPFSCSYCMSSVEKNLRFKNINKVKEELRFFIENRVPQVKFVDRTFNCNKEHSVEVLKFLLENDNGVTNFHFETAADLFSDEEIHLLGKMRKGLVQIETGVQTTNQETLKEIRRVMNFQLVSENTLRIKEKQNVHQHLDLIAGLPYETYEIFRDSFNQVFSLGPDVLQLGFLKVLKGSYMHEMQRAYGLSYKETPPYEIYKTHWISFRELLKLKEVENVLEIFYNSGNFKTTLSKILEIFPAPFDFFQQFGSFFARKNNFQKHSRINNYKLLLEFASEVDPERIEWYKSLLTHDLYLKEKMKTRPEFSHDQSIYKEMIRQKYQELFEREYFKDYENMSLKQIMNITHMEIFPEGIFNKGREFVLYDYKNRRIENGRLC